MSQYAIHVPFKYWLCQAILYLMFVFLFFLFVPTAVVELPWVISYTEYMTAIVPMLGEIQKIPELLDEIHWLIENTNNRFIMSGSSPRKIIRGGANLLGGRALRYELYPLIQSEIPEFRSNRKFQNFDPIGNSRIPPHRKFHNSD